MNLFETLAVSTLGGLVSLSLKWLFDLGRHKLEIRGQKDVFIHKTQFEKEFNAYAEIWVNIPDLTLLMRSYDDFSTGKLIKKREKELPELFEKVSKLIAENEPFLHQSVFESCIEFCNQIRKFEKLNRKLSRLEEKTNANAVENNGNVTDSDDKKWQELDEQSTDSLKKIIHLEKNLKDSIRKRIWNSK